MKEYIENEPVFSESIQITEPTDPAHADNINAGPKQLLQNTLANRDAIEELKKGKADKASVERLQEVTLVSLPAAGWTGGAAPFVQTVAVSGATETSEAVLVSALAEGASLAEQRAYVKAYGIVCSGTARLGAGTATFRVYKRPATDLVVGLRGVMG